MVLEQLIEQFRTKNQSDHSFSSQFFYQIRTDFQSLHTGKNTLSDQEMIEALVAINYMSSSEQKITVEQAKAETALLIEQCQPNFRNDQKQIKKAITAFNASAALLIRFLAHKGVE